MKKKISIFMVILLLLTALTGCGTTQEVKNEIPSYFLEPDGYIIAKVSTSTIYRWGGTAQIFDYGYIKEEDYQAYLDGTLTGVLVIKHPYEEGKEVAEPVENIERIAIGIYEDHRGRD